MILPKTINQHKLDLDKIINMREKDNFLINIYINRLQKKAKYKNLHKKK
jgi:hypothetical protein